MNIIKNFKMLFRTVLQNKEKAEDMEIPKHFLIPYLPSNPIILDCGAHIGVDTVDLAAIFGSTVHAIEAVPTLYEQLVQNTERIVNVKSYNVALSDVNEKIRMFVSSGSSDASSSILKPKSHLTDHPDVLFDKSIEVDAYTLDEWCRINGISKIDMLWLDMQGAEQKMLEASNEILKTVSVIHSEVSTRETYEGVKPYREYKAFLESRGFKVIREAIPKGWDMGNVVFYKKM